MIERVMEHSWILFEDRSSELADGDDRSKDQSRPVNAASSGQNNHSSQGQSGTKRVRESAGDSADDDCDEDDEDRNEDTGNGTSPKRLACPFRKYDSLKYGISTHRVCALTPWATIARPKYGLCAQC